MTEDELKRALAAAFERADKRWITPSGAILNVLRDIVRDGKIVEAAETYRVYNFLSSNHSPFYRWFPPCDPLSIGTSQF